MHKCSAYICRWRCSSLLAHKASHEGEIAAESIAGCNIETQIFTIPSVAYTNLEVAWADLTENEAKAKGIEIEKVTFPWVASRRALSSSRTEGLTNSLLIVKHISYWVLALLVQMRVS